MSFGRRAARATMRSAWTRRKLAAAVSIVPIVCAVGTLFVPRYSARLSIDPSSTIAATPSTTIEADDHAERPRQFPAYRETHVANLPCPYSSPSRCTALPRVIACLPGVVR